jgi:hypothetical protein
MGFTVSSRPFWAALQDLVSKQSNNKKSNLGFRILDNLKTEYMRVRAIYEKILAVL